MKYIKSYKIFEASKALLLKMDIIDIFQNVIDAGFDVKVYYTNITSPLIQITISAPKDLKDYLAFSKDDNSPERISLRWHLQFYVGLNIRDNIFQLKSYVESEGYKMVDISTGTYKNITLEFNKDSWFTTLNITLAKDDIVKESIKTSSDIESDLTDICLELEDAGFEIFFWRNIYKSVIIQKQLNGRNVKFEYGDIKETLERIKMYLGDKYIDSLVLPSDNMGNISTYKTQGNKNRANYLKLNDKFKFPNDSLLFKGIVHYKI